MTGFLVSKLFSSSRSLLGIGAVFVSIASAGADELPSFRVGTAPLVSPSGALTYYDGLGSAHTNAVARPRAAELKELAAGLEYDVDLIYAFVHENVELNPVFGAQKGALGAALDLEGTAFDQAMLMVELLEEADAVAGTSYSPKFVYGQVTKSAAEVANWLGIADSAGTFDPQALTQFLADGAMPATVSGGTVTLSHIWVQVTIDGATYHFDPSFNLHEIFDGIDVAGAMNFDSAAFSSAMTAGVSNDSSNGVIGVRNFNKGGIDGQLNQYANALLNSLKNSHPTNPIEHVIGGKRIVKSHGGSESQRLSSLSGYSSDHTWSEVPDAFRTTLHVKVDTITEATGTGRLFFDELLYVDEIYGRRLTIDIEPDPEATGLPQPDLYPNAILLNLDGQPIKRTTEEEFGGPLEVDQFDKIPVEIIVNHPYAASGGGYMDRTYSRQFSGIGQSAVIAHGWGRFSDALASKLGGDGHRDGKYLIALSSDCAYLQGGGGRQRPTSPPGVTIGRGSDHGKVTLAAAWLSAFTRQADLQARIGGNRLQHHHTVGLVTSVHQWAQMCLYPFDGPGVRAEGKSDALDLWTSISLTNVNGSSTARAASVRAIALSAAGMEGGVFEQLRDQPDTMSTVTRFEWLNREEPDENYWLFKPGDNAAVDALVDPSQFSHVDAKLETARLALIIKQYIGAGYLVISPRLGFLGPGRINNIEQCEIIDVGTAQGEELCWTTKSFERGRAIVAFKPDAAEISHFIGSGKEESKGGGGDFKSYDPKSVAEVLQDDFKDRTRLLGVDLRSGQLTQQPAPDIRVGAGEFPYSLSFQRYYSHGQKNIGLGTGWTHNWHIVSTFRNDANLALGNRKAIEAAAATTAAVALQEIYSSELSNSHGILARYVAAQFIERWRLDHLTYNSVVFTHGLNSQTFARLVDGSYSAAPGSADVLVQTGERAGGEPITDEEQEQRDQDATFGILVQPRTWNYGNIDLVLRRASGQTMYFNVTQETTIDPATDIYIFLGSPEGRISRWDFPSGLSLKFEVPEGSNSGGTGRPYYYTCSTQPCNGTFDRNFIVRSNLGGDTASYDGPFLQINDKTLTVGIGSAADPRTITFNVEDGGFPLDGSDFFWQGYWTWDGAAVMRQLTSVTRADGTVLNYGYMADGEQSADARPAFGPVLDEVFAASDTVNPKLRVHYGGPWNVRKVFDAEAVLGNRNPWEFKVAGGLYGLRQDPLGGTVRAWFDEFGQLRRQEDELGFVNTLEYDDQRRLIRRTGPEGRGVEFQYDQYHNIIKLTRGATPSSGDTDIAVSATYESPSYFGALEIKDRLKTVTDARGAVTTFAYDFKGNISQLTQPVVGGVSPVWSFEYDSFGQETRREGPENLVLENNYGIGTNCDAGRLLSQTIDPGQLNITNSFSYDCIGNLSATDGPRTDVSDVVISTYDLERRPLTTTDPLGHVSETVYDDDGLLVKRCVQAEASAPTLSCEAATWGNPGGWSVMETTYTETGKVEAVTDPQGDVERTFYDPADRPLVTVDPEGRKTLTVYDAAGRVTKVIRAWAGANDGTGATLDCASMKAANSADPANNLQQCYQDYTYTPTGQVQTVKDANGNVTTYEYDGHNRLIKIRFPDSSYEEFTYDKNGNRTSKRTRKGDLITFEYDALNRKTRKGVPGLPDVAYAYDLAGRQTSITQGTSVLSYQYDGAARVTAANRDDGRNLSYQYDEAGNRTRLTYPGPGSYFVVYVYDALNRMTNVIENDATTLATLGYDPLSRTVSVAYGNGTSATLNYEPDNDLASLSHSFMAESVAFTFGYNKAAQLTSQSANDTRYVFAPDLASTDAYAVNNLNQYANVSGTSFSYDLNGSLTGDGANAFAYDAENRLMAADMGSGVNAAYAYDPLGRRTLKTIDGTQTDYLYDDDHAIAEYDGAALLRRYVYGPGVDRPIVLVDGAAGARTFYHQDRSGSVVALTDEMGIVTTRYVYDAYGVPYTVDPATGAQTQVSAGQAYLFTGRRFDFETGLYYYRARYYSAPLGRFLQTDPVGYEDQMNLYVYVGNDPVNKTDPTGKFFDAILDAVFIVADVAVLAYDEIANKGANRAENLTALGADAAGLLIPGATGLGITARLASASTKVTKSVISKTIKDGGRLTLYSRHEPHLSKGVSKEGDFNFFYAKGKSWRQNKAALRAAMKEGKPIGDVHVDDAGNLIKATKGTFLYKERRTLEKGGWEWNKEEQQWEKLEEALK